MAYVTPNIIAVDSPTLARVRKGDLVAVAELRDKLNGIVLYEHALCTDGNDEFITIGEAIELGLVGSVKLLRDDCWGSE